MASPHQTEEARQARAAFYAQLKQAWELELEDSIWGFKFTWDVANATVAKANRFAPGTVKMPEIIYLAQTFQKDAEHGFNLRFAQTGRGKAIYQLEGRAPQSADSVTKSVFLSTTSELGLTTGKSNEQLEELTYAVFDLMAYMVTNRTPWHFQNLEEAVDMFLQ